MTTKRQKIVAQDAQELEEIPTARLHAEPSEEALSEAPETLEEVPESTIICTESEKPFRGRIKASERPRKTREAPRVEVKDPCLGYN